MKMLSIFAHVLPFFVSSLAEYLFRSFAFFFLNWIACFLILTLKFLENLNTNPLSDMHYVYIFSQPLTCLFILSHNFQRLKFKILMKSELSNLFLIYCDFNVFKNSSSNPRSQIFSPLLF